MMTTADVGKHWEGTSTRPARGDQSARQRKLGASTGEASRRPTQQKKRREDRRGHRKSTNAARWKSKSEYTTKRNRTSCGVGRESGPASEPNVLIVRTQDREDRSQPQNVLREIRRPRRKKGLNCKRVDLARNHDGESRGLTPAMEMKVNPGVGGQLVFLP